jgi:hypothetical protein
MSEQKVLEPGAQIVYDAMEAARNEIKTRATEALYTHYKAIQDKRKYCSIHGRNFNADSEGMAMALEFRQLLSFTRLILNDKDFFTDQMDIEI